MLSELPTADVPGASSLHGPQGNNYSELVQNKLFSDKYNVRVDHKFSDDSFSVFGRWSWTESLRAFEGPNIPGPSGSNQNGFVDILNKQLTLGGTYSLWLTPRVFDLRFSVGRRSTQGKRPPLTGGPSMFDLYGITGLPDRSGGDWRSDHADHNRILHNSAVRRRIRNIKIPTNINHSRRATHLQLGNHSIKVGYEYLRVNTEVQDTNPLMGLDTYSGQFSKPFPTAANNNLYNLADFMFGARSQYRIRDARPSPR